ncbi:MAG: DUF1467 family protein [Parvularculaceae bacterium]
MNPAGVVVVYILVWWCAFFVMLPLGVRSVWEDDAADAPPGVDLGAPQQPDLKRKAVRATWLSLPITVAICLLIISGVVDFKD